MGLADYKKRGDRGSPRGALAAAGGKDLCLTRLTQGPNFPSEDLHVQLGDTHWAGRAILQVRQMLARLGQLQVITVN